jgi:DNA-binding NarL/FixJ family response regulator
VGIEARLLELDPDAYIVMLSGQGNRENILHSMQLGAKGFIGKPFTPEKLFSYVHKCPFVQEKRKKALSD